MLLTYILIYHYGLTIYILDLSIYYKFKIIILFFLKKKEENKWLHCNLQVFLKYFINTHRERHHIIGPQQNFFITFFLKIFFYMTLGLII